MITVICEECGKEKQVYPSIYARYKHFFCNYECRAKSDHKDKPCKCGVTRTKENTYTKNGGKLDNLCKTCRIAYNTASAKNHTKEKRTKVCG